MLPLERILEILEKKVNLSREELLQKIEAKQKELSGLVSKEGAAYLVARDFGVELEQSDLVEIKDLVAGMRRISLIGRIFKVSDIFEFERKDGSRGRVINLFIGDPTGYIKLPLWNDRVKLVEDGQLKLGDVVRIRNGLARENIFGDIEISLGKYGSIEKLEKEYELPSVEEMSKRFLNVIPERTEIKDLEEGIYEIKGTLVQVFRGKFIFSICPVCKSSVQLVENKFVCEEHGEIEPEHAMVISGIIDDGSANLRVVFFRENAEKLLGISAKELKALELEERFKLVKERVLGLELVLVGRVKKNKIFDRLEFVANKIKDLNIREESKKLAAQIRSVLE